MSVCSVLLLLMVLVRVCCGQRQGVNDDQHPLHKALTSAQLAAVSKLLKADPPDGMSLRSIVQLLHELDNDQKRYEMKLAENRLYRERLLRWLLCDKKAEDTNAPNRVLPPPHTSTTGPGRHDMNTKV